MNLKKLKKYTFSKVAMTEENWKLLSDELSVVKYAKGGKLLLQNGICNRILFLNSGVARSYVLDVQGREFTCTFNYNEMSSSAKNLFLTDYASIIRNEPSKIHFESLSEIEDVCIPTDVILKLHESNIQWNKVGRIITEEAYFITQQRTLSLLTLTALERYQQLMSDISSEIVDIPELYIASYLGITPLSLSRLKKS